MTLHEFIFGAYPYLAGTIFLAGSWLRFDREQYTWKSDSTQLLSKRGLRLASNLFHVGIIAIFFGHLVGMLTPHSWFQAMGVSDLQHQYIAIIAGIIFGGMTLVGGLMLLFRRIHNPRIRAAGRKRDAFTIGWLVATVILGLSTIPWSLSHAAKGDVGTMLVLVEWVQSVAVLRPNPALIAEVDLVYKLHVFFGMTVFLIFPFTRLVHVWSVPLGYLGRAYQIVRTKHILIRR
jgi:nitrate reductase gamma subunit